MNDLFLPSAQLKISLTSDCNNDCPICLNQTTRARGGRAKRLPRDRVRQLIREGAAMGMAGTYWTGGEPLMQYRDLLAMIELSAAEGLTATVVTNGGLLGAVGRYRRLNQLLLQRAGLWDAGPGDAARRLREAGLTRIYFSIDSNHTTLESADSGIYAAVPVEVAARSVEAFLTEGFGTVHELEAIGHRLRITATASGRLTRPTDDILRALKRTIGAFRQENLSAQTEIWRTDRGKILVRRLGVSNVGDAGRLGRDVLEDRTRSDLFNLRCPHFIPQKRAYDDGKHHRDLFVDSSGVVYTCGNHAFAVGSIWDDSLSRIVQKVNQPDTTGEFGMNRAVFRSLLLLSERLGSEERAVGDALRLAHRQNRALLEDLRTQCGACNALGSTPELQQAFLEGFRTEYGEK